MSISDLLAADPFARSAGIRLVEGGPGRIVVAADLQTHHRDASGRVSSGALFAVADCALSLISNTGRSAVAVATHLTRLAEAPVGSSVVVASIEPVSDPEARSVTYRATLTVDDTAVAQFTGTTLAIG